MTPEEIDRLEELAKKYEKYDFKTVPIDSATLLFLLSSLREKEREAEGWKECAAQFSRNMDFYRDLVDKCAAPFGKEAYISDDGSIQDEVVRLKVPELIETALREASQRLRDLDDESRLWDKASVVRLVQRAESAELRLSTLVERAAQVAEGHDPGDCGCGVPCDCYSGYGVAKRIAAAIRKLSQESKEG